MLDLIIIYVLFRISQPEVSGFNLVPVSPVLKKAQRKLINKSSTLYHPNF